MNVFVGARRVVVAVGAFFTVKMTRVLVWTTRIGIFGLILSPLFILDAFVSRFGPLLRDEALVFGLATMGCLVFGLIQFVDKKPTSAWRGFYLVPALGLGFIAYCNTGNQWELDRATVLAKPYGQLEALLDYYEPLEPPSERVAEVYRDVKIANARREYESALANLHSGGNEPLPETWTPWLWTSALLFLIIAFLPEARIREVFSELD